MSALGVLAGLAALQAARAEPASPLKPAISDNATANSRKKQTLTAAISNAAVARGTRRGGDGADAARRARDSFGADVGSGLVGGSFAWPYYNYCMRHPDQNC
jgi:hypothetical protein